MEKKNQVVENKVSDVTGIVTTDVFATKVEKKIQDDTVLVTASVLTTIEIDRKILDASGLIGNKDYDSKISDLEKSYFAAFDYKKFTSEIHDAKINKND